MSFESLSIPLTTESCFPSHMSSGPFPPNEALKRVFYVRVGVKI